MERIFTFEMAQQIKPKKRVQFISKLTKLKAAKDKAEKLEAELSNMLLTEAIKTEHEFFVNMDGDINGTSLLREVSCSPEHLQVVFPELDEMELEMELNSMCDSNEKYSDSIIVSPKSNPKEVYTIYAHYGDLRIGGFEEGPNFEKLYFLLNKK